MPTAEDQSVLARCIHNVTNIKSTNEWQLLNPTLRVKSPISSRIRTQRPGDDASQPLRPQAPWPWWFSISGNETNLSHRLRELVPKFVILISKSLLDAAEQQKLNYQSVKSEAALKKITWGAGSIKGFFLVKAVQHLNMKQVFRFKPLGCKPPCFTKRAKWLVWSNI